MEKIKMDSALRDKAKLTQEELAEKLGVDRSTVTKWETGGALPRASMLPKIASILGCAIDDLFCPASEETAQEPA